MGASQAPGTTEVSLVSGFIGISLVLAQAWSLDPQELIWRLAWCCGKLGAGVCRVKPIGWLHRGQPGTGSGQNPWGHGSWPGIGPGMGLGLQEPALGWDRDLELWYQAWCWG